MKRLKRIGILGGTFNPIHIGHLILAEQSRQLLHLNKVIFVPTYISPHKSSKFLAPAHTRYQMVSLAVKNNPYFEVSDLELVRGGISYSIETVRRLKTTFPQTRLFFITGSDFLDGFSTWKDIEELSKICKFVIAQRPGYEYRQLRKKMLKNIQKIYVSALDISSTQIRRRIKSGQSIRYLVSEEVRGYILQKKLYR
jgi:nicotinate-nucleotide adenylyltransferase